MVPTRDHDEIRQWADRHDARPVALKRLKYDGEPAILSFVSGDVGIAKPDITPISCDSFFAQFDLLKLSLAFDEDTPRFNIVKVERPLDHLAN